MRPYKETICVLWIALVLVLAATVANLLPSCRAALPVRVQVYQCQTAVEGVSGQVTLEQCRVVDDSAQDQDQTGNDQVDVDADGKDPTARTVIRALAPAVVPSVADGPRPRPRRKRAKRARRVRVKGYTRRAPARRRRR